MHHVELIQRDFIFFSLCRCVEIQEIVIFGLNKKNTFSVGGGSQIKWTIF